ncbi:pyocin knob domain-containing protein [Paenibacillus oceani]|uniref:Tail fiber protein n=1 Tax=Paenibacillus oceani TaxID=2772510 RepID=A0A927C5I5_9BACL|nr:pyocin knob domain-containing protein [Paenibacillus oceani]MBD2860528.1 tail fiber protein [Paenibacillus oceani]
MQLTPNLNLKKPEGTDVVDIADLNENTDKLDTEVAKLASTTTPGRMSAADKTKLDNATNAATASTLVQRDASGRFKAAAPAAADDVARRQEVTDHADLKATTGGGYGHTTLVDSTSSVATDKAATANAVKQAFDQASRVAVNILPIGMNLDDVIAPGFYRLQTSHSNNPHIACEYGNMLVVRGGSDTITQLVFAYSDPTYTYIRCGNPPQVSTPTGLYSAWAPLVTSKGTTFIGNVEMSPGTGLYLGNMVGLVGKTTNGSNTLLAHVNDQNVSIFGGIGIPSGIHSSAVPTWYNGAVMRNLIHDGGGQTINGITTFGNITVNGLGLFAGASGEMEAVSGQTVTLEVRSNSTTSDAFMSFHIPNNFACHFGLDANTQRLQIGGWSMGTNSYKIWDQRGLFVSTTPHANPQVGDIWIDTST